MLSIYACTLLIGVASLAIGRAVLELAGWPRPAWLSGATGLAVLVIVAPFLLRLPGRATTAAIMIGIAVLAAALYCLRTRPWPEWPVAVAVVAITLALATLPFVLHDRVGVLGEGIYTNDHAAQLYWADWLQNAFGPEPSAVRFGYPIGPQAVAVIAAEAGGASLVSAFNGLLLAIPALTALTALGALERMPPVRRIAIAAICGLPYLAASFLAQSAFKETAMGLFVLAFAIALAGLERAGWRAVSVVGVLLAAAAVFTFSIPGLAWFVAAAALWLALEELAGRSPIDWGALREAVFAHRLATAITVFALLAIAVIVIGPATEFIEKINDVQASAGRLSSPVFPGEALGIWPAGDFRLVRGEVSGSLVAVAVAAVAVAYGLYALVRRRELALLAMMIAGGVVYLGARAFAEIHVEAKALAVAAPLVLLVALRGLLAPNERGAGSRERSAAGGGQRPSGERRVASGVRYALGSLVLVGALASTLLALRAAPIGYDQRQLGLERLAERVDGDSVVFLGVDRFSGYYLRGTLARAPAGYVPEEIESRPEKTWQQGMAADFDTVDPAKLDKFDYAITTAAAYGSSPPENFAPIERAGDYVLWERRGETPRSRVLAHERGNPGAVLDCDGGEGARLAKRTGTAIVLSDPVLAPYRAWDLPRRSGDAAAGQERGFDAGESASISLELPSPGDYELSIQYHSQVPLEVLYEGEPIAELPASLDGMYLSGAGRGAFWPAGEFSSDRAGNRVIRVRSAEPSGLADAVGAQRRVWLGDVAASPVADPKAVAIADACERYVDRFALERRGEAGS